MQHPSTAPYDTPLYCHPRRRRRRAASLSHHLYLWFLHLAYGKEELAQLPVLDLEALDNLSRYQMSVATHITDT